jgi:hypothetical protein
MVTHRPVAQETSPASVLPTYGSDEHLQWLAARLTRNLRFRTRQEAFSRLSITRQREWARQLSEAR